MLTSGCGSIILFRLSEVAVGVDAAAAANEVLVGGTDTLAAARSASDVAVNDVCVSDGVDSDDAKDGVNEVPSCEASEADRDEDREVDSRAESEVDNVGGACSGAWASCSADCI